MSCTSITSWRRYVTWPCSTVVVYLYVCVHVCEYVCTYDRCLCLYLKYQVSPLCFYGWYLLFLFVVSSLNVFACARGVWKMCILQNMKYINMSLHIYYIYVITYLLLVCHYIFTTYMSEGHVYSAYMSGTYISIYLCVHVYMYVHMYM